MGREIDNCKPFHMHIRLLTSKENEEMLSKLYIILLIPPLSLSTPNDIKYLRFEFQYVGQMD